MSETKTPLVTTLTLSQINADETFNSRKLYDGIEALAADMKRNGQLTPVLVRQVEPGKYSLISGFRRVRAVTLNKWDTVRAQIMDCDAVTAAFLNLIENIQRNALTSYELAAKCSQISTELKLDSDKIGEGVGISGSHVANLIRCVRGLHPEIVSGWMKGHKLATLTRLIKWARMKDQADQLAEWESLIKVGEDETDGQTGGSEGGKKGGKKGGKGAKESGGQRGPNRGILEGLMITLRQKKFDRPETWRAGAVDTMKFVLGHSKKIPGVYDPQAIKDAEKAKAKNEKKTNKEGK